MGVWRKLAGFFEPKPMPHARKREVVVIGGPQTATDNEPGVDTTPDPVDMPPTDSISGEPQTPENLATVQWQTDPEPEPPAEGLEEHSRIAANAITLAERERKEQLDRLEANYARVLNIIEKVDQHLDTQDDRSKRMMEIAETFPQALEKLDAFGQRQTDMNNRLASFGTSFEAFGESFQELARSTDRLGGVLASIKERDAKRDEQLRAHVERSQKWMTAMVALTAVGIVAAIAVATVAIVNTAG